MRRTVLVFKDAEGLFWNDRYKPVFEVICNLILSIPLTIHLGISGTFLGTIFTNIFVSGAIEAYILFTNGFKIPVKKYFLEQFKYYCIFALGLVVSFLICKHIAYHSLMSILVKGVATLAVLMLEVFIFLGRSDEFRYVWKLFGHVVARRKIV